MSLCELLSPLILCTVLVVIRSQIDSELFPSIVINEITIDENFELSYAAVYHYPLVEQTRMSLREEEKWMEDSYALAGVVPRSRLFFIPRACFWTGNYAT